MIKTQIRAETRPWRDVVAVVVMEVKDGRRFVAEPLRMVEINDGHLIEPTVSLNLESAQVLMDDLWNCGLRPTEGTGSAGALRAVERHLDDMRALVFKKGATNGR